MTIHHNCWYKDSKEQWPVQSGQTGAVRLTCAGEQCRTKLPIYWYIVHPGSRNMENASRKWQFGRNRRYMFKVFNAAETLRPADCYNPNWSKHVHVLAHTCTRAQGHADFLGLPGYVLIWHTGEQCFSASEYEHKRDAERVLRPPPSFFTFIWVQRSH